MKLIFDPEALVEMREAAVLREGGHEIDFNHPLFPRNASILLYPTDDFFL